MSSAILYNLKEIIRSHPNYVNDPERPGNNFDTQLVAYLFSRLSKEDILKPTLETYHESINIKSNVPGLIEHTTLYRLAKNDNNNSQASYAVWQELLEKNAPYALGQAKYIVEQNKNEYEIGFSALYALKNWSDWYELYKQDKMPALTEKEEKMVVENLITGKASYKLFSHLLKDTSFTDYAIQTVIKHYHSVRKSLKKDEKTMLATVFGSSVFLTLLNHAKNHDLSYIFSPTIAADMVKKADTKENAKEVPFLVSTLLPLLPASQWVPDSQTAMIFLQSVMKRACGFSQKELNEAIHSGLANKTSLSVQRSTTSAQEWLKRIEYLGQTLSNLNWTEEQKNLWYASVFLTEEASLLEASLKYISLPTNQQSIVFQKWALNKPKRNNEANLSWLDLEKKSNKERLEQKLHVPNSSVKKLKI